MQEGDVRINPSPPVAARGVDESADIAGSGLGFLPDLLDLLLCALGALGAREDFCVVEGAMSGI